MRPVRWRFRAATALPRAVAHPGFSLLEALLASSMLAIILTAVTTVGVYGQQSIQVAGSKQRAIQLAQEGLEATRSLRDGNGGFAAVTTGAHGIALSNNQWSYSGLSDTVDIYTRVINVTSIDANRKSVSSTVTWAETPQRSGSVVLTTYITNWTANQVSWALNGQTGSYNAAGTQDGIAVATSGRYAYITRSGSTPDFLVMDISAPATPTLVGSLTLGGTSSGLAVNGSYVYVASSDNTQELKVIDVATPASPSLVGGYNTSGTADATSVVVAEGVAYFSLLTSTDYELYAVSVSTPSSPSLLSRVELAANATDLVYLNKYLYVSSADNAQELKVIDVTTPSAMAQVGSLNLTGTADATDIAGLGSTVYLARGTAISSVSVAIPATPLLLSSAYTALGTVNDLALKDTANPLLVASAATGNECEFVNVTTPAVMVRYSSFNLTGAYAMNAIAYSAYLNKAIAVGSSDAEELVIVEPR